MKPYDNNYPAQQGGQAPMQSAVPPTPQAPSQGQQAPPYQGRYYQQSYPAQPLYQPNMYLPQKKVYQPFGKKDTAFLLLFLAVAILLVDFAFFGGVRLGFTIAYFVLFGVTSAYLWSMKKLPSLFSLGCGLLSLAGAVTFALTANIFVNTVMFVLIGGLFTLYALGISHSFARKQGNFKMLLDLGKGGFLDPFEGIGDVVGSVKAGADKGKKHLAAFFGVLLAVPVLCVIVPLLIKSDAAFEGMVASIAKNLGKYLLELLLACVLTPFLFSFMFVKRMRYHRQEGKDVQMKRAFPVSGAVSFLTVISLTYMIYLFSQLAYFFSAFKGFLPEGYTRSASAFARRGFFEMFAICAINIVMISIISACTRRKAGKPSMTVKLLSLFISLFSLLLIATAIQKMRLNIATYGYTRNRILVFVFMLMMIVVLGFFILHIFAPKISYMQPIILICAAMFVALSFADIDTMTASHNVKAYAAGEIKIDVVSSVANIGSSAAPSLIELTKSDDADIAKNARRQVIELTACEYGAVVRFDGDKMVVKGEGDFRQYNKANAVAGDALVKYYSELTPHEKENFRTIYHICKEYDSYEKKSDSFKDYEKDTEYKYNKKTGIYDKKVKITYED